MSMYNVFFDYNGSVFVYNTLTNKYIECKNTNVDLVKRKIQTLDKGTKEFEMLVKTGIITAYSENEEMAICDSVYYNKVFDNTLSITLITTDRCNFLCRYCPQEHNKNIMSAEIYDRVKKLILKNIHQFQTLKLILFGGEPTLAYINYENFLNEVNELCKFYKKTIQGVMITNGFLLSIDMVRKLYKRNITQFQITLDGSREIHDRNRCLADGSGTFDVVYKNLKDILEAKELIRLSVAIRINTTRELLEDVDNWKSLYEIFAEDQRFVINMSVVEDRGGNYIANFKGHIISENDDIYRRGKEALSKHRFYEDRLVKNYFACKDISRMSFTVDCNGDIRSCSKLYTDNIVGYLCPNGTVKSSRNNELFYLKTETMCRGCSVEPLCHGKRCGLKVICDKDGIIEMIKTSVIKGMSADNHEILEVGELSCE
jgi:uncharacterized protein